MIKRVRKLSMIKTQIYRQSNFMNIMAYNAWLFRLQQICCKLKIQVSQAAMNRIIIIYNGDWGHT